jgi:hypothetical protein
MFKLNLALAFCVISLITGFASYFVPNGLRDSEAFIIVSQIIGPGVVIIWIWMLTDFFRRTDIKQRVLWGWLLFIFNLVAGLLYFIFVFYPYKCMRYKAIEH